MSNPWLEVQRIQLARISELEAENKALRELNDLVNKLRSVRKGSNAYEITWMKINGIQKALENNNE